MKALEILKNEILIKERAVEVIGWGIHNLFEYREALQELEDLQNRSCKNCKFGMIDMFDDDIECVKIEAETQGIYFTSDFCCNKWEKNES